VNFILKPFLMLCSCHRQSGRTDSL